ncbi:MAG: hypothetical protein A2271_03715 [Candidatus Moranbacteria bacterium RIFOXYA12_FULL_35_19]|nr:MAG: Transcriptional regulator, TrmB [Candidatus Moranbacteria bacterium GW2011_GWF2_35_39]OGI31844.1 MAG: hypothetical protein A2343_01350 [Candidatus Moranbacteria bacterium RIFOXYB12_FULL_35_8]OGI33367.1 MAG: hypothetical protein A2489_03900 [Candidatus Moranbacteria bacterium RIFOXYC12_FULL_36_13]OGI36283.1 MAG: hypothetical protein A2271_03715 [Candidatus Moranbacteria bacterium RIFOXYA12_FULL_35_19]
MNNKLEELGFNKKEARVYMALLESGPAPVSKIARLAKINRTTGYDILERLVGKKLVRPSKKSGKIVYIAENPENIQKLLEEEANNYLRMSKKACELLPNLKSLYLEIENKPIVKFYEGLEGLKSLYEDSLTSSEEIRSYTSTTDLNEVLGKYAEDYFSRRSSKNISIRSIVPVAEYGIKLKRNGPKLKRYVKLVPSDRFGFSPEIYIYDNKLTVMSLRERFGVYIESKEISEALKKSYELAWEQADKYDRKIEEDIKAGKEITLTKNGKLYKKSLQ